VKTSDPAAATSAIPDDNLDGSVHASKKRDNTSAEVTPNTGSGDGSLKTGNQNHPFTVSPESDEVSNDRFGIVTFHPNWAIMK
jgi:hypothetical protein